MEKTKTKVRIYGQEYTIIGEKPEQEILEIAKYVDEKMHIIGRSASLGSSTSVAVLAAVNIADELYSDKEDTAQLKEKIASLQSDTKKYVDLWDEAKRSLVKHRAEIEDLQQKAGDNAEYRKLEEKYRELQSSYFDLKNENMKLRSSLEKAEKQNL